MVWDLHDLRFTRFKVPTACRDNLYRNVVIPYKITYMDYEDYMDHADHTDYTDQKGHIP